MIFSDAAIYLNLWLKVTQFFMNALIDTNSVWPLFSGWWMEWVSGNGVKLLSFWE
jgi:hypothetical protein